MAGGFSAVIFEIVSFETDTVALQMRRRSPPRQGSWRTATGLSSAQPGRSVFPFGPTQGASDEDIDTVYAVNVKAPFILTGELAPAMAARGKARS